MISRRIQASGTPPDIRTMMAEVMTLTQADMEAVVFSDETPVVVRRFAESLLRGDVKEMAILLDQALGKPVERHLVASSQVSSLSELTTEELRALLAHEEKEEGGQNEPQ